MSNLMRQTSPQYLGCDSRRNPVASLSHRFGTTPRARQLKARPSSTTLIGADFNTIPDTALEEEPEADPIPPTIRLPVKRSGVERSPLQPGEDTGERQSVHLRTAERVTFFVAGLVAGIGMATVVTIAAVAG